MAHGTILRILARPDLSHDQALVALAKAFTGARPAPLLERLDDAATALLGTAGRELRDQAHALAELVTNHLCLGVDERDHRALLLDHALRSRQAHPILIATIGHELARRAGFQSFVATAADCHWTVLTDQGRIMVVGYGTLPDPHAATELQPRCAHDVTNSTLQAINATGPRAWRQRAAMLSTALAAHARAGFVHDHSRKHC